MFLTNRQRLVENAIKTDSLIDILVSVVGFMIVLVLFTVIAGRGKHIVREEKVTVLAPILQQSVVNIPKRRLVLCQDGRASILDLDAIIDESIGILEDYERKSDGVKEFNRRKIQRFSFHFSMKGYATPDSLIKRTEPGLLILVINRVDSGERLRELHSSSSKVVSALKSTDSVGMWVHFLVDKQSVDVFRFLRTIAHEKGALVGWEPIEIKFPIEEPLTGVEGNPGIDLIRGFQQTR